MIRKATGSRKPVNLRKYYPNHPIGWGWTKDGISQIDGEQIWQLVKDHKIIAKIKRDTASTVLTWIGNVIIDGVEHGFKFTGDDFMALNLAIEEAAAGKIKNEQS